MPHGYDRRLRVADHLKNELANLLLGHSHDPRFKFVSITAIEIAKDYSQAKVFVSILNESKIEETLVALNKAAGFFRRELAQNVNLRSTPRLHFYYDDTILTGNRISELLSKPPTRKE